MTGTVTARSVVAGDEELVIPGERLEEFRAEGGYELPVSVKLASGRKPL